MMFDLMKIFDLSKIFAVPKDFIKLKIYFISHKIKGGDTPTPPTPHPSSAGPGIVLMWFDVISDL